jgi:hypothetical protein
MAYEDFRDKIATALQQARNPLTWTEIRTSTGLPQLFPNNQWVHRLEKDIGLRRTRDASGIIHWKVSTASVADAATPQIADAPRARSGRKQGSVE